MKTSERLESLFQKWESKYPGSFVRDGIISADENQYLKAKERILFLLKEPNDEEQTAWSLTGHLRANARLGGKFAKRLAQWAFGLLNGFPPLSSARIEDFRSALLQTSVINLKKVGGGASSKNREIEKFIINDNSLINEEIEILNPTIIVGGIYQTGFWSLFLNGISFANEDGHYFTEWKGRKIIDIRHPSTRIKGAAEKTYLYLRDVLRSERFLSL